MSWSTALGFALRASFVSQASYEKAPRSDGSSMRTRKSAIPRQRVRGEDALVDDLGAGAERLLGAARGLREPAVLVVLDLDDLAALVLECARNAASCSSPLRAMSSACALSYGAGGSISPR